MNKKQEKIAEKLIEFLKSSDGLSSMEKLFKHVPEISPMKDRYMVIGGLKEINLIKDISSGIYGLTEDGWKFESFEKLEIDNSLEKRLTESNIRANELNIVNAKYNRIATVINIIIGTINIGLLIWQLT